MSRNKHNYRIVDMDKLQKYAKNAVIVVRKPIRGQITKLIDAGCNLEEAGIQLIEHESPKEKPPEILVSGKSLLSKSE